MRVAINDSSSGGGEGGSIEGPNVAMEDFAGEDGLTKAECRDICAQLSHSPFLDPNRISCVNYERPLGDGAYCVAYRAELEGVGQIALRVVKSENAKEVIKELKQNVSIRGTTVETYGVTVVKWQGTTWRVAQVMEICEMGNMDDFIAQRPSLSSRSRVGILRAALRKLCDLKRSRVVWRDLKGQNMLVRRQDGEVVDFVFCDFGFAVTLPENEKRRMTLNGPGTEGYIAPETKTPDYQFSCDMWAFLVWACSICVDLAKTGAGELEHEIAKLKLNTRYSSSRKAEEAKVKKVLRQKFLEAGLVREDCRGLFELLSSDECPWTQPELRWTAEEAHAIISQRFGFGERARVECLSPSSCLKTLKIAESGKENASLGSKPPGGATRRVTRTRSRKALGALQNGV